MLAAAKVHHFEVDLYYSNPEDYDWDMVTEILFSSGSVESYVIIFRALRASTTADVNAKDKKGIKAPSLAASHGHEWIVGMLLAFPNIDV